MLTADLLRARVRKGVVVPQYVLPSEDVLAAAADLIGVYQDGVGRPMGELTAQVDAIVGDGTDFLLWRGLAKLLDDRSVVTPSSTLDAGTVRQAVFARAFDGPFVDPARRMAVLAEVAAEFDATVDAVEEALYADLADRQLLTAFEEIDPPTLIARYNVALAQAVLYRATRLVVRLERPNPDRLRYLMSALKFHGLMHRARHEGGALEIEVDGPASLFKLSRKYGLKMATFLPALLLLDDWSLSADLDWKGRARKFELHSKDGLRSHYRARGQWRTEEEQWFEERFNDDAWELERRGTIVELRDGEVLVADYVLRGPAGVEVAVEIVSFWRAAYLRRRIELLDAVEHPLVLVVSERLKADREKLDVALPLEVVFYKGAIVPKKVVAAACAAIERRAAPASPGR